MRLSERDADHRCCEMAPIDAAGVGQRTTPRPVRGTAPASARVVEQPHEREPPARRLSGLRRAHGLIGLPVSVTDWG